MITYLVFTKTAQGHDHVCCFTSSHLWIVMTWWDRWAAASLTVWLVAFICFFFFNIFVLFSSLCINALLGFRFWVLKNIPHIVCGFCVNFPEFSCVPASSDIQVVSPLVPLFLVFLAILATVLYFLSTRKYFVVFLTFWFCLTTYKLILTFGLCQFFLESPTRQQLTIIAAA